MSFISNIMKSMRVDQDDDYDLDDDYNYDDDYYEESQRGGTSSRDQSRRIWTTTGQRIAR